MKAAKGVFSLAVRACALAATAAAFGLGAQAQAATGVVYIESNIGDLPGRNSVLAYRRDAQGHLNAIGEYLTGGTGVAPIEATLGTLLTTLGPYDSDQNLILNAEGTRLFAVNSGSDSIAVFDVRADGSLSAVSGSPFPSHGVNPVSLGLARGGDILTVVNKDYDLARSGFDVTKRAPNYTTFFVGPRGKLLHVPFSNVETAKGGTLGPGNPNPSQALIAPDGHHVFDADTFNNAIVSLDVRPGGRLVRVDSVPTPTSEYIPFPPAPSPSGRPFPLGLIAHPTARVLYAGFVFEGRAGVYSYDAAGRVSFVRSADAGPGICWLVVNASGNRVYTSNTLVNSISVLDTTDPLNPVEIQEFPLVGGPAATAQIALSPDGTYLYAVSQKGLDFLPLEANALHVLRLAADGTIAAQTDRLTLPNFPSQPQGVVAR